MSKRRDEAWAERRARAFLERTDVRRERRQVDLSRAEVTRHLLSFSVWFRLSDANVKPSGVLLGVSRVTGRVWREPIR